MSSNTQQTPSDISSSYPPEQKLMEGVYFTDFRKKTISVTETSLAHNSPIQMRATIQELKMRLGHLHYSNDEMRKAMKELKGGDSTNLSQDDKESITLYEESIFENIIIIERDEKRVRELEEKLRYEEMKSATKDTKEMLL